MRAKKCRQCRTTEKPLSEAKFCRECSAARIQQSGEQLKLRKGDIYEKWKVGMKKFLKKL